MKIYKFAVNGIKYVAKDVTKGPVAFKDAVYRSNKLAKKYNSIHSPNKRLARNKIQLESMRRGVLQNKNLRKELSDPGQIGSAIGLCVPIPGAQPLGYAVGKLFGFLKRTIF